MRIVGGSFKGRRIIAPSGNNTRPTTDRTREAIFNVLAHHRNVDLEGALVLDLFAGSGALGLEALSRGGARCVFIDEDAHARGVIRDNIEALGLFGCTRIQKRSAIHLGPMPANVSGPFTLAFLDPPYGRDLAIPALTSLQKGGWLADGAAIVLEQAKEDAAPSLDWIEWDDPRGYGDTLVYIGIVTQGTVLPA